MKSLTIQLRLTAWYFLSLAIIVAIFAGGSWFAMKASMYHAIDRDLGYRMGTVVPFIQSHSLNNRDQFAKAFATSADSSVIGVFVQVADETGILYESDVLRSHRVPLLSAGPSDGSISNHIGARTRVACSIRESTRGGRGRWLNRSRCGTAS